MTDILFYHLETQPLIKVLPQLLEKSLERGWRIVVQVGDAEQISKLDADLWTYSAESFLPHSIALGEGADHLVPVLLTTTQDNQYAANIRFFVLRAMPKSTDDYSAYERLVIMFNGLDEDALNEARAAWRDLRADHTLTYWQQDRDGRFIKKA